MKLDKGIFVKFGGIEGTIYGGPYRDYARGQRRLVGLKMAEEINHPHDFKVDTADFSVPSMSDMGAGIQFGLDALKRGKDVYVGCMGGTGRTGLYMACMAKVMRDYCSKDTEFSMQPTDPIKYVREWYKPHAVETRSQMNFVDEFQTGKFVEWLREVNSGVKTMTVEKKVLITPLDWIMDFTKALRFPFGG